MEENLLLKSIISEQQISILNWIWTQYKIEPISCIYYENSNWSLKPRKVWDSFFLLVTKGCLHVELENSSFDVHSGSLLMLGDGIKHKIKSKNLNEDLHQFAFHAYINNVWGESLLHRFKTPIFKIDHAKSWISTFHNCTKLIKENEELGKMMLEAHLKSLVSECCISGLDVNTVEGNLDPRIEQSLNLIHRDLKHDWTVEELANSIKLGVVQFRKIFKRSLNITPKKYIYQKRIQESCHYLKNSQLQVKEIAYKVGFKSDFYYQRTFKNEMKCTPTEFRTKHWL